jgi:hypothetical protein
VYGWVPVAIVFGTITVLAIPYLIPAILLIGIGAVVRLGWRAASARARARTASSRELAERQLHPTQTGHHAA